MPIGTPFHPRTAPLNQALVWRDWSGYFAAGSYEVHHDREYSAIRNAAALIDVSPLFKYLVTGKDAQRLIDRIVTRDMAKVQVGQVLFNLLTNAYQAMSGSGTLMMTATERNGALGALTALLVSLMGSVIGGWMASGEPMTVATTTRQRTVERRVA